jgi:hypothetical protein
MEEKATAILEKTRAIKNPTLMKVKTTAPTLYPGSDEPVVNTRTMKARRMLGIREIVDTRRKIEPNLPEK